MTQSIRCFRRGQCRSSHSGSTEKWGVKPRRNTSKFQENSVVFYAIFCWGLLQREGHLFVALLQPACLLVFTRVFKFLSPLSLPISPPGRVTCEEANYGIFLRLIWWVLQNCPSLIQSRVITLTIAKLGLHNSDCEFGHQPAPGIQ